VLVEEPLDPELPPLLPELPPLLPELPPELPPLLADGQVMSV